MKAYWLDTGKEISTDFLKSEGIHYEKLDTANYQADLDRIKTTFKYASQDIVELNPETPNLNVILAKFDKEHLHTDDEVRFVLEGDGIFDIRASNEQWMRVEVTKGDYISVPENRYHRFFCTKDNFIKCVRLFKENPVWTPFYRSDREKVNA